MGKPEDGNQNQPPQSQQPSAESGPTRTPDQLLAWATTFPNPFLNKAVDIATENEIAQRSLGVSEGTYAVTTGASTTSALGSIGEEICVAAALYRKETQTAAVAHFRIVNDPHDLIRVLMDMFPDETEEAVRKRAGEVTIALRGAKADDEISTNLAVSLLALVDELGLTMRGVELFSLQHKGFIIDAKTGEIVTGVESFSNGKQARIPGKGPVQLEKVNV